MATCRTNGCNGKPRARGICVRCYAHLRVLVTKGQITWDELVNLGLVDAAAEGPAKDTPIKRAMAAAKVKLRPSQPLAVIDPDREPPEYDRDTVLGALTLTPTQVLGIKEVQTSLTGNVDESPEPLTADGHWEFIGKDQESIVIPRGAAKEIVKGLPPEGDSLYDNPAQVSASNTELLDKMRQVGQKTTFRGVPIEYEPDTGESDGKVFIVPPEQAAGVADAEVADTEETEDPKQAARRRKIEAKHLNQQKEDAKHGPPMPMPPPPCAGPSAEYVDMGEVRGIIAKEGSGCKVEFSPSAPGAQAEMPTPWLADKREVSRQNEPIVTEHDNIPFSLPPPETQSQHEIIVTPGAPGDLERLAPKGLLAPLPGGENAKPVILLSDPTSEADYPSDIDSKIQVPPPEATEIEAKPWE